VLLRVVKVTVFYCITGPLLDFIDMAITHLL
jgi:hypothetical protein